MKVVLAVLCLLVATWATVVPRVGPVHSHVPLTYKVSLDDPPVKRWTQIVNDYMVPLKRFMEYFDMLPIPKQFFNDVQWYAKNVYQQKQFVAEIEALAEISGYPFEKIFFLNFMYEYSTFKACTGILIRTEQGKILHGRNLDFEMWDLLAKLVANIEFYKGGKRIFNADMVVGSVFVLTGERQGAFAINVDTRTAKHFYEDLISVMKDNAMPTCWLLRKVLQEQTNYNNALERLKTERIGGPVYYVLSGVGPNQASVLERDVDKVHAHYQLNQTNWFLIQTNYDRDYPDPKTDPRRIPVQKKMRERGNKNFTTQTLMNEFMFQWPTFNIATIMTAIMVPGDSYHNTTIWYGDNPQPTQSNLQIQ